MSEIEIKPAPDKFSFPINEDFEGAAVGLSLGLLVDIVIAGSTSTDSYGTFSTVNSTASDSPTVPAQLAHRKLSVQGEIQQLDVGINGLRVAGRVTTQTQAVAAQAPHHKSHLVHDVELYGGLPTGGLILGVIATAGWRYLHGYRQRRSIIQDFKRAVNERDENARAAN